jgi:NAD(P)-dependent dehydrogenase (short-subunit alcohol dehydrogenase family)
MKESTALITGVSRGFGLELTREYCRLGWQVFGVLRSKVDGAQLSSEFGEAFVPILVDLRDDAATKNIRMSLEGKTDPLSLLINNAGIGGTGHYIEETSCSEIKELFDVHCCGAIRCLKAALPFLRKAERATVVNVSSRVGSISKVSSGHLDHIRLSYSMRMAKAAQNMLSASLHRELRKTGIAVFAVHPGKILTRMASPDADMSAEQAAKRFVNWLPKIRKEREFGYFEAGAEELSF